MLQGRKSGWLIDNGRREVRAVRSCAWETCLPESLLAAASSTLHVSGGCGCRCRCFTDAWADDGLFGGLGSKEASVPSSLEASLELGVRKRCNFLTVFRFRAGAHVPRVTVLRVLTPFAGLLVGIQIQVQLEVWVDILVLACAILERVECLVA
jgi:hypothetical protein